MAATHSNIRCAFLLSQTIDKLCGIVRPGRANRPSNIAGTSVRVRVRTCLSVFNLASMFARAGLTARHDGDVVVDLATMGRNVTC